MGGAVVIGKETYGKYLSEAKVVEFVEIARCRNITKLTHTFLEQLHLFAVRKATSFRKSYRMRRWECFGSTLGSWNWTNCFTT